MGVRLPIWRAKGALAGAERGNGAPASDGDGGSGGAKPPGMFVMARDDASGRAARIEGTVVEALPHGLYRVSVERQQVIVAHAPGGPGRNFIRVIVGDRVELELAPRDRTRGRIVSVIGR